jgi:hypothetical protein
MSDSLDRPNWITDELVTRTISHFQTDTSDPFGCAEAVQVLLSLSQLLEATGTLKLEFSNEDVYGMGKSE